MAKFKSPNQYRQRPAEAAVIAPAEAPQAAHDREDVVIHPSEKPAIAPKEICGINGCTTWYDNPLVMKRHRERAHGIGAEPNLNQPKPRNAEIKLA
jgi:hypothetical protein